MEKVLNQIDANLMEELISNGSATAFIVQPLADHNRDKNTPVSSSATKFVIYNNNVYCNIYDGEKGDKKVFSRLVHIKVNSDNENPHNCYINLTYMEGLNQKFNSRLNMDFDSTKSALRNFKTSDVKTKLQLDKTLINHTAPARPARRPVPAVHSEEIKVEKEVLAGKDFGIEATEVYPVPILQKYQTLDDIPDKVDNIADEDLFIAEDEKQDVQDRIAKYARLKDLDAENGITPPNEDKIEEEIQTPPLTSQEEQQTEKANEAPRAVYKPPKEKDDSKNGIWKNGGKDLVSAGIKAGIAGGMIFAFMATVNPLMLFFILIASFVAIAATETVIDFVENSAKNAKKIGRAGFEKSHIKNKEIKTKYREAEFTKDGQVMHELEREKLLGHRLNRQERKQLREEKKADKQYQNSIKRPEKAQDIGILSKKPRVHQEDALLGVNENGPQSYVDKGNGTKIYRDEKSGLEKITMPPKNNSNDASIALFSSGLDELLDQEARKKSSAPDSKPSSEKSAETILKAPSKKSSGGKSGTNLFDLSK